MLLVGQIYKDLSGQILDCKPGINFLVVRQDEEHENIVYLMEIPFEDEDFEMDHIEELDDEPEAEEENSEQKPAEGDSGTTKNPVDNLADAHIIANQEKPAEEEAEEDSEEDEEEEEETSYERKYFGVMLREVDNDDSVNDGLAYQYTIFDDLTGV